MQVLAAVGTESLGSLSLDGHGVKTAEAPRPRWLCRLPKPPVEVPAPLVAAAPLNLTYLGHFVILFYFSSPRTAVGPLRPGSGY